MVSVTGRVKNPNDARIHASSGLGARRPCYATADGRLIALWKKIIAEIALAA
jgi:hypothetical protein